MNGCPHTDFLANVEICRLFDSDVADVESRPDSLSIDVRAWCKDCGKSVRFEGPIGVAVGPGAPPMVSLDGTELHAAGHMGENLTPTIIARFHLG